MASVLIAHGAEVNARDDNGSTPLHDAGRCNKTETARVLLSHGADVNARDSRQEWTPLHNAVYNGYSEVAGILVKNGADVNMVARDNMWTPLHRAAYKGRSDVTRLLLENGAKTDVADKDGNTPLHLAIIGDAKDREKLLNDLKKLAGGDKSTTIILARDDEESDEIWEMIVLLISHGADINAKNSSGLTPLKMAVASGKNKLASLLRSHGAKE